MPDFIRPDQILDQLSVKENTLAAEFGCGSGEFALELAKRAPEGKVYGMDVQKDPLSVFEKKARSRGIYNTEAVRCDLEQEGGTGLPQNYLDLVLIPNVLFQAEEKGAVLREAERILKPGGRLLIIDWHKEAGLGPQKEFRISEKEVEKTALEQGFEKERELKAGAFHWALLFKKT